MICPIRMSGACAAAFLCACSLLPGAGPTTNEIADQVNTEASQWYQLVDVDENVISVINWRAQASLLSFSQYKTAAEPVIGIGDVVKVTVWEAAPGNLFNASISQPAVIGAAGGTTIPEQVVPRAGTINVPFAGDVPVVGRTPRAVEKLVSKRLASKAIDPQVLVNVIKSVGNAVTVTGDAVQGGQVQLSPGSERVLDAVALVGGIKSSAHETFISLVRGERVVTVPFLHLTTNPAENIRLGPGDLLFVSKRPRTYTILGATRGNAEIPFDAPAISLAQAIARGGGLLDDKADATGVFVFRYELPAQIPSLIKGPVYTLPGKGLVPVIYRLNLRNPKGMFLAQAFPVKEGDMIFVSNAPGAEFSKFLQIVNLAISPAINGAAAYSTFR